MKGITAAPAILSTPNLEFGSRCARLLAGPLNTPPPRPTSCFYTQYGVDNLGYLIGQQRPQSSPHSVSKSSGNRTPVAANLFRLIRSVSICGQTYGAIYLVKRLRSILQTLLRAPRRFNHSGLIKSDCRFTIRRLDSLLPPNHDRARDRDR